MSNASDFYCEQVLSKKTKVKIEYESETVLAFHHTKPSYKTHIVIIPKERIASLVDISDRHQPLIWEMITVAKELAQKLDLKQDGARLITNLGKFQDSPHLHFHLISGTKTD